MKPEIKLKDSKWCNGCLLLNISSSFDISLISCRKYRKIYDNTDSLTIEQGTLIERPKKCIEENGE